MPIVGAVSLYVSLLTFTLRVHPDRLDYVDQVLVCFLSTVNFLSSHKFIFSIRLLGLLPSISISYRLHLLCTSICMFITLENTLEGLIVLVLLNNFTGRMC